MKDNYSYLPDGGAADVAQIKAAKGILEWANVHLPEHHADADEPFDQVESVGFSAIMDSTADEPTKCLGFACNMPAYICDVCKLFRDKEEIENSHVSFEVFAEINRILSMGPVELDSSVNSVFQSWHDARRELYLSAPASRGIRASIELRAFGRMKF